MAHAAPCGSFGSFDSLWKDWIDGRKGDCSIRAAACLFEGRGFDPDPKNPPIRIRNETQNEGCFLRISRMKGMHRGVPGGGMDGILCLPNSRM